MEVGNVCSNVGDEMGNALGAALAEAFRFKPDVTATWYQPAPAKSYVGLGRFGAGEWV